MTKFSEFLTVKPYHISKNTDGSTWTLDSAEKEQENTLV